MYLKHISLIRTSMSSGWSPTGTYSNILGKALESIINLNIYYQAPTFYLSKKCQAFEGLKTQILPNNETQYFRNHAYNFLAHLTKDKNDNYEIKSVAVIFVLCGQ